MRTKQLEQSPTKRGKRVRFAYERARKRCLSRFGVYSGTRPIARSDLREIHPLNKTDSSYKNDPQFIR